MWRYTTPQSKALNAVLLATCKKLLFEYLYSEAVCGNLGIESLYLKRNKRKVILFLRLLKKRQDSSVLQKVFEKE